MRALNAVESWEKFDVPESRWPLAWEMVCAISCVLSSMGELDAAVFCLMSFDLYSRPTESLWVRAEDVLFPIPGTSFKTVAVRLNPHDRGVPSKVGIFDEVLAMTTGKRSAAGIAVGRLATARKQRREEYLFSQDYQEMAPLFTRASKLAGLGHRTLYELRHGGASDDALMGVTWQVIKERGCWAADRSVARYRKKGMLQ